MESICFECRKKLGHFPKGNGCHTAERKKCDYCGEVKSILPGRHWVRKVRDD